MSISDRMAHPRAGAAKVKASFDATFSFRDRQSFSGTAPLVTGFNSGERPGAAHVAVF
jgi:hypothetical protein